MRRRAKPPRPAGRAKRQMRVNDAAAAPAKPRVRPPLGEQFYVAVDRQLKSGYGTYAAAEKAALAIKKQYPLLQVTVYDAKEQRYSTIERPKVAADPQKKPPQRVRSRASSRRAAAGGRH